MKIDKELTPEQSALMTKVYFAITFIGLTFLSLIIYLATKLS